MSNPSTALLDARPPKKKRQQKISCGACYFRRVKCDLRDKIAAAPAGVEAKCTNCEQRNVQCVNEFEKAAHKPRKAERGVGGSSATLPIRPLTSSLIPAPLAVSEVGEPPSSIPDLHLEFFASPFFRRFHTHRPILDPTEFSRRCREAIQGNPRSLGRVGKLISKILVAWAASYGVDESGRELVASIGILQDPLVAPPDLGDVKQRRMGCNAMTEEILTLVDQYGVLRTASWDGVRALLLLVPLTEDILSPTDRMALYQSALNQLYILTSAGAPSLPDQGPVVNKIAMARTFWYAHVHEGVTNGIRGRKLIFEQDDISLFKDGPIPYPYYRPSSSTALVHTPLANTYTYRLTLVPIRVSFACREINASLTGPKALRHQVDEANEQRLKRAWELLTQCWDDFEDLRNVPGEYILTPEDTDRFCGSWQIFIFDCQNIVLEALKVRQFREKQAPAAAYGGEIDEATGRIRDRPSHRNNTTARLIALSESICRLLYPYVIRIITRGLSSPSFFQYDAMLTRDGVLFAATWAPNDLDRSICLQALASMRWAYSFSDIRVELLHLAWDMRSRNMNTSHQMRAGHPQQRNVSTANTMGCSLQGAMDDVSPPPSYAKEPEPSGYQYQYLAEPSSSLASYSHVAPAAAPSTTAGTIPSAPELNCPDLMALAFDPEFASYHQPADAEEVLWDTPQWNQAVAETVTSIIRPYTPALQPPATSKQGDGAYLTMLFV